MTRKKSGVDWTLTPCCGAKPHKVVGILRCPSCRREVPDEPHQGPGHIWDAHDREYLDEIHWASRDVEDDQ